MALPVRWRADLGTARLMVAGAEVPTATPWDDDMRLHVSVADIPVSVTAIREQTSTGRQQLAIAAHDTFVGVWSIDDIRDNTFVCFVPHYEAQSFVPLAFDVDFDAEGPNPTIRNFDASRRPSVSIARPMRFHARTTIMMIDQVDTVLQSFRADALVEMRLRGVLAASPNEAHVLQLLGQYG
jgi:hypothetical protein